MKNQLSAVVETILATGREKNRPVGKITGKFRFWSKISTKNGAWGDARGEGRSKKNRKIGNFFGFIADFFEKTNESFFFK